MNQSDSPDRDRVPGRVNEADVELGRVLEVARQQRLAAQWRHPLEGRTVAVEWLSPDSSRDTLNRVLRVEGHLLELVEVTGTEPDAKTGEPYWCPMSSILELEVVPDRPG